MAAKEQTCAYCGDPMGVFEHSNRLDGPLSCGKRECNAYVREEAEAERSARPGRPRRMVGSTMSDVTTTAEPYTHQRGIDLVRKWTERLGCTAPENLENQILNFGMAVTHEVNGAVVLAILARDARDVWGQCICSPDNQAECCPRHGRFATLQEAWDGGREHERAMTAPDVERLIEERDELLQNAEASGLPMVCTTERCILPFSRSHEHAQRSGGCAYWPAPEEKRVANVGMDGSHDVYVPRTNEAHRYHSPVTRMSSWGCKGCGASVRAGETHACPPDVGRRVNGTFDAPGGDDLGGQRSGEAPSAYDIENARKIIHHYTLDLRNDDKRVPEWASAAPERCANHLARVIESAVYRGRAEGEERVRDSEAARPALTRREELQRNLIREQDAELTALREAVQSNRMCSCQYDADGAPNAGLGYEDSLDTAHDLASRVCAHREAEGPCSSCVRECTAALVAFASENVKVSDGA